MNTLLKVSGLRAGYGQAQVLFGVDFAVAEGEVVTLLGRNGMGRSTAIKCLFGLLALKDGAIEFAGERISGLPSYQIAKRGLGLVPEGRQIFPNLSVEENLVATARNRRGHALPPWTLDRVYGFFPRLRERRTNLGSQLSGGEQQMLAMARALMGRPRLLLLDEPSMGLAPLMVQKIFETVRTVAAEGVTMLLVEQNAKLALETCHRGYVMESGGIVLADDARRLLSNPQVRQAYLGE